MQRSLFLLWNELLNQVPIVGLNKTFFLLSGDLPHPPTVWWRKSICGFPVKNRWGIFLWNSSRLYYRALSILYDTSKIKAERGSFLSWSANVALPVIRAGTVDIIIHSKTPKFTFSWVSAWFRSLTPSGGDSNCFNGIRLRNGEFMSMASRKEKAHFMVPAQGFGLWGRDLNGLLLHINWNSFWVYL